MRYFNTEGLCNPNKHYMVDITERLVAIREMIDAGKYFVINRGRQYGKTTTINELCRFIQDICCPSILTKIRNTELKGLRLMERCCMRG